MRRLTREAVLSRMNLRRRLLGLPSVGPGVDPANIAVFWLIVYTCNMIEHSEIWFEPKREAWNKTKMGRMKINENKGNKILTTM